MLLFSGFGPGLSEYGSPEGHGGEKKIDGWGEKKKMNDFCVFGDTLAFCGKHFGWKKNTPKHEQNSVHTRLERLSKYHHLSHLW